MIQFQMHKLLIISMILFLIGCATGHHQLYTPGLAQNQVVHIKSAGGLSKVYLLEVDGRKGPNVGLGYGSSWDAGYDVEVSPGPHTLKLSYKYTDENLTVPLLTKPSHIYVIGAKVDSGKGYYTIYDQTACVMMLAENEYKFVPTSSFMREVLGDVNQNASKNFSDQMFKSMSTPPIYRGR